MERLPYDPNLRLNELQPFRKLFEIESEYMASQGYYQNERFAALRQFRRIISKCNPFDAFVPFLAMSYFDRFVSSHNLPEEIKFDSKLVRKMELYILNALEWRMRSLTAIGFSGYFVPLLGIPSMMQPVQPVYQIIIRAQAGGVIPMHGSHEDDKVQSRRGLERADWRGTTDSEADKPEHVGTSSSSQPPAKPRSDPIPNLGSQAAKPHQLVQASSALLRAAIPPGLVAGEVEDLRGSEKTPLDVENEEIFEIEGILQPKTDPPAHGLRAPPDQPTGAEGDCGGLLWMIVSRLVQLGLRGGAIPMHGSHGVDKVQSRRGLERAPIGEGTTDSEADKPEYVGTSRPSQPPTKPRSDPIPIPGSREAKPTQLVSASSALLRAAIPPGFDYEVERLRRSEKAPLEVEMEEILQPKINDPYMNFELRWTNPQEPKVTAASVLWALVYDSGPISPIAPGGSL
ncbi:hypothetical protein Acr_17g0004420 [Actinidia rufa]|uniref:Uncharacterized protein n=1 Tax=Actinidia rufa TaxID=165716 RepID=A0A7J0G261_9ERIC|nr:hypothetical protein Acr_17g0004420 [Actinidia rufa]